jgi:asparagine synthase (glutamine-hydrolysing)
MFRDFGGLEPWQKVIQAFMRTFLVDTVLAKTDRSGMAFGLEARVPFLDNEMVEFAAKVPFRLRMRGMTSKYLLRKLLQRKLARAGAPPRASKRRKQGFSIPIREWLRGDLKYLLDEYLSEPRIRREGYFQPERVDELVQAHLRNRANHSHLLWSLISFQMWKDRFLG